MSGTSNPYPNRPYPVGDLNYSLTKDRADWIVDLKRYCMLEYGEKELLFDIPRILGMSGNYLNLGHARGGSALLLARGLMEQKRTDDSIVYSIDTFKDPSIEDARETLHKFDMRALIHLLRGTTDSFVNQFSRSDLAFLFIDADHSYEGVRKDFINYSPRIIKGGAVAFHDTNQEPSHRVIEENITNNSDWQLTHHVNRIKVFKRI